MVRSLWKPKYFFNKSLSKYKDDVIKKFKVFNSNFYITIDLIGYMFFVYTGNKFRKIIINKDKVGFLLSSLVITRFNDGSLHTKKKKKKKKK